MVAWIGRPPAARMNGWFVDQHGRTGIIRWRNETEAWGEAGFGAAVELDYVPLPNQVKDLVRATWQNEIKDKSGQPLLKKPS